MLIGEGKGDVFFIIFLLLFLYLFGCQAKGKASINCFGRKMNMEEEEGAAAGKSTPSGLPTGEDASGLASGESATSASANTEGDEDAGAQVKVPAHGADDKELVEKVDHPSSDDTDDEMADKPDEGEYGQVKISGGDEAVDDNDGSAESVEEGEGDEGGPEEDLPSEDDDDGDDDGWSTVSEDEPMEGQAVPDDDEEDSEDDDVTSLDSHEVDIDSSSDEEDVDEGDNQVEVKDDRVEDGSSDIDIDVKEAESSPALSSESAGDVGGQLHPMKNPVVLKNMFELCPPSLLAKFRLVCKQWRDLSLDSWRSTLPLTFSYWRGKVELEAHGPGYDHFNGLPLKEFLKYVKDPEHQCGLKPFRRFYLAGFTLFPIPKNKRARVNKLLEVVKRDATVLELASSFYGVEAFREVMYNNSPNLQQLVLNYCTSYRGPTQMGPVSAVKLYPVQANLKSLSISMEGALLPFRLTWLELLSQFPSLARLILIADSHVYRDGFPASEMLSLLEVIQTIRKTDPKKLPLAHFEIHDRLGISHEQVYQVFSLLRELRLPGLHELKLCTESKTEMKLHELSGASEIDVKPLRKLTVYQNDCGISTWKFPFEEPLENLTMLELFDMIWENMEFLKFTPNLEELRIIHRVSYSGEEPRYNPVSIISNTNKQGLAELKLPKLTKFHWGHTLAEDDLPHLANWFPNLKLLHAPLNDKLFSVVCEQFQFRALEDLHVTGTELTDEGITGLRAGQIVEDPDSIDLPPNIRMLQNLSSFTCYKSGKLTDVSIYNGFLKMPKLKSLSLDNTTYAISKEGEAALKAMPTLNTWIT